MHLIAYALVHMHSVCKIVSNTDRRRKLAGIWRSRAWKKLLHISCIRLLCSANRYDLPWNFAIAFRISIGAILSRERFVIAGWIVCAHPSVHSSQPPSLQRFDAPKGMAAVASKCIEIYEPPSLTPSLLESVERLMFRFYGRILCREREKCCGSPSPSFARLPRFLNILFEKYQNSVRVELGFLAFVSLPGTMLYGQKESVQLKTILAIVSRNLMHHLFPLHL